MVEKGELVIISLVAERSTQAAGNQLELGTRGRLNRAAHASTTRSVCLGDGAVSSAV